MTTLYHRDLPEATVTARRPCDEATFRASGWVTKDELAATVVVSLEKSAKTVDIPADSAPKKAWIAFAKAHGIDVDPKTHAVEYVAAVKSAVEALAADEVHNEPPDPDADQQSVTDSKES